MTSYDKIYQVLGDDFNFTTAGPVEFVVPAEKRSGVDRLNVVPVFES